ncbi:MAG: hypothetical protein KGL57_11880, partial [Burkholderiales bacterium]|nr:hypothetical protein [Burkholderiales bacterium]
MLDRIYQRSAVHGMVPHTLVQALAGYVRARGVDPTPWIPKSLSETGTHALERVPAEAYCQLLIRSAEHLQ